MRFQVRKAPAYRSKVLDVISGCGLLAGDVGEGVAGCFTLVVFRISCCHLAAIGTASANSAKFRGIRPRMYIEDLL